MVHGSCLSLVTVRLVQILIVQLNNLTALSSQIWSHVISHATCYNAMDGTTPVLCNTTPIIVLFCFSPFNKKSCSNNTGVYQKLLKYIYISVETHL